MPNWCLNTIKTKSEKIHNVFHRLMLKEDREKKGVEFKYMKSDKCFFDIYIEDDYIMFSTKWSPPLIAIHNLAKRFDETIVMHYYEPGIGFYGTFTTDGNNQIDDGHDGLRPDDY